MSPHGPKHCLAGAELIQIADEEPTFPCWTYHKMFGFSWQPKFPGYFYTGTNIIAWLKLSPNIDQSDV